MKYGTTVQIQFNVAKICVVVVKLITGSRRCMREIQAVAFLWGSGNLPIQI